MVYRIDVQYKHRDEKKNILKLIYLSLTIEQSTKFISLLNNLIFDTQFAVFSLLVNIKRLRQPTKMCMFKK